MKLLIGGMILAGILYLIRRLIGVPVEPNDGLRARSRLDTLIEGTRQKPYSPAPGEHGMIRSGDSVTHPVDRPFLTRLTSPYGATG